MNNIFSYNLNNIEIVRETPLDKIQKIMSKINAKYKVTKYLGDSYDGDIYLVTNKRKKLICKKIKTTSESRDKLRKYYKLLSHIKANQQARQFINEIVDYRIYDDYMYVLYPYFKGNNLIQLKDKLDKLEPNEYNLIVKHIIKKTLIGLNAIHNQGVIHNGLNDELIAINTDTKNIKIKFFDLDLQNNGNQKLKKQEKQLYEKDVKDCGTILENLLTHKYNVDLNNQNNNGNLLTNALKFLRLNKNNTVEDLMDDELLFYLKEIRENMIEKPTLDMRSILKEIMFNEKYDNNNNNNN